MRILVVGGGSAGIISALILKEFLNVQIDVVYSDKVGIVGVGEGSTEHFADFMKFVGIDDYSIIKECDATYKTGIMFEDWGVDTYLHSIGGNFNQRVGQYPHVYARQIAEGEKFLVDESIWQNKINKWFMNKPDYPKFSQYHFNTYKLNNFLKKRAEQRGIVFFEDTIEKVEIDPENGNVSHLKGLRRDYSYDFYIDSTGFKRLVIGKLGANWKSFGKHLKVDSAVTFPTSDEEEYNLWTVAKAMNAGWMFRLPVWGRYGNGYIFSSDHINMDEAKEELSKTFNKDLDFGKEFSFDPGHLDKVWIKNCVAVGLSGSFVEPLEATSIGTTIQQAFLLMHKIIGYTERDIDRYNKSFTDIMENIRDFIFLHYMTERNDTSFWQEVSGINPPDSLAENLEVWEKRMPMSEDFAGLSNYILFKDSNFINVLYGLNKFDRDSIRNQLYSYSPAIAHQSNSIVNENLMIDTSEKKFGHKKFIKMIREDF